MATEPLAPAAASARDSLRRATRASHHEVEASAFARELARGRLSPAQYGAWLGCLRRLHEAIERRVADSLDPRVARVRSSVEPRAPRLRADLDALAAAGGSGEAGSEAAWGAVDRGWLDALEGPALLGALYTLEGSALGGQVILPALRASGRLPAGALGYYEGHGAQTRERFARFAQRLDEALADPADAEAAGQGARRAFEQIGALFAALGAPAR